MLKSVKKLFYITDKVLPVSIAKIPYTLAANVVNIKLRNIPQAKIWFRNSFIKNNLVFGISDLDIGIMIPTFDLVTIKKIKSNLAGLRIIFPFIGENNFYIENQIHALGPSLNVFEKHRDPVINTLITDPVNIDFNVEKIVFLLRMLYADKANLQNNPEYRQKKWKSHFNDLNLPFSNRIDKELIINTILYLIDFSDASCDLKEALDFIFLKELNMEKIYTIEKPKAWKFLFPHIYFWNDDKESENLEFLKSTTILKKIFLRQVDWEIWGLGSQLPYIMDYEYGIKDHVSRLRKVVNYLDNDSLILNRIDLLIENSIPYEKANV